MNTLKHTFFTALVLALAACTETTANAVEDGGAPPSVPSEPTASSMGGIGTWEGTGHVVDTAGTDLGEFTVSLTRKMVGTRLRSEGKVILAGHEAPFWQEFEERGASGFKLVSSSGAGGGRCFANGMCQTYEARADGHAFATTIAQDGTDRIRIVVTELDKGQAVKFFQETLAKKA